MATVNWPSSPSAGTIYEFDGNYWYFTSAGGWRKMVNGGQVSTAWIKVSNEIFLGVQELENTDTGTFVNLSYV